MPGIRDKKHAKTYQALIEGIEALGFDVTEEELCSADFGVPQNRRRVVLLGMRKRQHYSQVKPRKRKGLATVREAIGGLMGPAYFKRGVEPKDIPIHPNHWTMQPKSERFERPQPEIAEQRSFKRLDWDSPSRTIAFGHREIHVIPQGHRRLSIYEALLLQGFRKTSCLKATYRNRPSKSRMRCLRLLLEALPSRKTCAERAVIMPGKQPEVREVHDELGLVASIRASQGTKELSIQR